jgi:hypothetical protein
MLGLAPPRHTAWLSRYLNPVWQETLTLRTRLSPEECMARLQARLVSGPLPRSWWAPSSGQAMRGRVSRSGFALAVYHFGTRPRRTTEATGAFVAQPSGTRIVVRLGMSRLDAACLLFWPAFVLCFAMVLGWTAINTPGSRSPEPTALWLLLGMPLIGLAVCVLRRWTSRDDAALIRGMLVDGLDAAEVTGEPSSS